MITDERDFSQWYQKAQELVNKAQQLDISSYTRGVISFHKYFFRLPSFTHDLSRFEENTALPLLYSVYQAWKEQLEKASLHHYLFLSLNEEYVLNSSVDLETETIEQVRTREGLPGIIVNRAFPNKWDGFSKLIQSFHRRCFEIEERDVLTGELVGIYHVWQLDELPSK